MRRFLFAMMVLCSWQIGAFAQESKPAAPKEHAATDSARPLPDMQTLFRDIVKHQKELDEIRKNYMFREESREEEMDGSGAVKKTTVEEHETFYIGRRQVSRMLSKNGKLLTEEEKRKEEEQVQKNIEEAKKKEQKREDQHKDDDDQITVETFLKIAKLTNERREMRNGNETIVCDFTGDPNAKTHGMAESAVKKISGTMWIDENRRQLVRMEAKLDDNFKVGGGVLAKIEKGSSFAFEQALVNDEIWLPTFAEANVTARVLLFKSIRQHQMSKFSDYRKFRSKSVVTLADDEKAKPQ
jgi:hypothetical protein